MNNNAATEARPVKIGIGFMLIAPLGDCVGFLYRDNGAVGRM
jgi:hypothetical protein